MADASFWTNSAQATVQRRVVLPAEVVESSVGAATTVMAMVKPRFILLVHSTFNQDVSIVVGDDDFWRFPANAGQAITVDLRANQLAQLGGQVVGVYHHGTAPTLGYMQMTVIG